MDVTSRLWFFESETKESWTWFMRQLNKVIDDIPVLGICSNVYKGLLKAMSTVFPYNEKRECFRHLVQNFMKKHIDNEHLFPPAREYMK